MDGLILDYATTIVVGDNVYLGGRKKFWFTMDSYYIWFINDYLKDKSRDFKIEWLNRTLDIFEQLEDNKALFDMTDVTTKNALIKLLGEC